MLLATCTRFFVLIAGSNPSLVQVPLQTQTALGTYGCKFSLEAIMRLSDSSNQHEVASLAVEVPVQAVVD